MAKGIKLKPDQPPRRFVGIDITNALDTVAWGHLWNATFGWRNLLWELGKDPADKQRRIDKAHPKLPIARLVRKHKDNTFADTCIMPQGIDAKGTDKLWAGPDAISNIGEMTAACTALQTFILSPGADSASSSLNDTGSGAVADVVYLSSHGTSMGDMSGEQFGRIFELSKIAVSGGQFSGPGWLLLSNCSTLKPTTHSDWIKLMSGNTPLRGIVGFQDTCPLAPGSVGIFASFINRLALGKTFIDAWSEALTAHGLDSHWIVLCHDNARGDKIADWNANKLTTIPPSSKIFLFDKSNPTGVQVVPAPDPFEAFWSKGGTRIDVTNRTDPANLLAAGDQVSITVKPLPPATTFTKGDKISITLVFVRTDYEHYSVDITKMFTVVSHPGASGFTTDHLNPDTPGPIGARKPDSWTLTVTDVPSAPTEVVLNLKCLDLTGAHTNYNLWLRVDIGARKHDFIRNGSILVK